MLGDNVHDKLKLLFVLRQASWKLLDQCNTAFNMVAGDSNGWNKLLCRLESLCCRSNDQNQLSGCPLENVDSWRELRSSWWQSQLVSCFEALQGPLWYAWVSLLLHRRCSWRPQSCLWWKYRHCRQTTLWRTLLIRTKDVQSSSSR